MRTNKEFNDKYKDYLEEGHYGLDINHLKVIEYLDSIFQDLIKYFKRINCCFTIR